MGEAIQDRSGTNNCASSFCRKMIARARALLLLPSRFPLLHAMLLLSSFIKRPITSSYLSRVALLPSIFLRADGSFGSRFAFVVVRLCVRLAVRARAPLEAVRPPALPRIVFCWLFAPNRFIRRIPTEAHLPRPSFNSIAGLVVTWVVTFLLTVAAASI